MWFFSGVAAAAAAASPNLADLGAVRAPADVGRVRCRVDFFFRTTKKIGETISFMLFFIIVYIAMTMGFIKIANK